MVWKIDLKDSIYDSEKVKQKRAGLKEHGQKKNYERMFSSFKDHSIKIENLQTNLIRNVT